MFFITYVFMLTSIFWERNLVRLERKEVMISTTHTNISPLRGPLASRILVR